MISIICPCYNAGSQLARMIDSVLSQTRKDVELIIVDGMSDDADTLRVLHQYKADITIIREDDCGLYDAMNKGVRASKGEWLYFIGADDQLADPSALSNINTDVEADIIVGHAIVNDKACSYTFSWRLYFENTMLHQAVLYRRSVFDHFSYIPHYTVSSDYDLNLYLYTTGARAAITDTVICRYATKGVSSHVRWQSYSEEIQIRRKYIKCRIARACLYAYSAIRFAGRKLRQLTHA